MSLIANFVAVSVKNIGLNEYEGHHLYDMIYDNESNIKIDAVTGDNHILNQLNFLALDAIYPSHLKNRIFNLENESTIFVQKFLKYSQYLQIFALDIGSIFCLKISYSSGAMGIVDHKISTQAVRLVTNTAIAYNAMILNKLYLKILELGYSKKDIGKFLRISPTAWIHTPPTIW